MAGCALEPLSTVINKLIFSGREFTASGDNPYPSSRKGSLVITWAPSFSSACFKIVEEVIPSQS